MISPEKTAEMLAAEAEPADFPEDIWGVAVDVYYPHAQETRIRAAKALLAERVAGAGRVDMLLAAGREDLALMQDTAATVNSLRERAEAAEAELLTLRAERDEARELLEVSTFTPWLRDWCRRRFGKWITHNTAKGALNDLRARSTLSPEDSQP